MSRRHLVRPTRPVVAVVWDHHELLATIARRTAGGVKLIDTLCLPIAPNGSVVAAAAELAEQLRQRHVTSFQLLIGLSRSQLDMLTLQLPPATEAELPELVRNEVARQLPDLPDESPIDFWLPEGLRAGEPLTVEAAVLRADLHETVKAISQQLKQRPAQIVVRSLAIASLFTRQIKNLPARSLLLNLMRSAADLLVLEGRRIVFTRSVHLSGHQDQDPDVSPLADEIRRTLFVAPRSEAAAPSVEGEVRHVYMFADLHRHRAFVEQLAEELQLTVTLLDPLSGVELTEGRRTDRTYRFAALIGMLWDFLHGSVPLDLANPHQPPPPRRLGRRVAVYAVAAMAALAIVVTVLKRDIDQATQRVESLTVDVDNNRQLLKKLQQKTVVLDAVQQWERTEFNWLDLLCRLSEQFPASDQAVVQRISMAPSTGGRGVVSMSVRVQDPAIIAELEQRLRDDTHQVSSQRISQSDPNQDFSTQFETSLVVTPPQENTK